MGPIGENQCSTQNTNHNAALEPTDENTQASNALWETFTNMLATGGLLCKATNPKKARPYAAVTLLKRISKEHGPSGDVKPV